MNENVNREQAETIPIGDELYALGMPIVACSNLPKHGVVNSHKYTIDSANDKTVTLKRGEKLYELSHKVFTNTKLFRLGFCDSIFRNQGYTLTEPHNIYDAESMCLQDIYTALSRFKQHEDIGINAAALKGHVFAKKIPPVILQKHKLLPLKNATVDAIIYRIYDAFGNQYIGYTTRTMAVRYAEHKEDPNEPEVMKEWLDSTPTKIELVRTIKCIDLAEVRSFEAAHIAQVPRGQSKNIQEKREADMDWDEKCKFAVPKTRTKPKRTPKVAPDPKRKAFKVQRWIDGKNVTKYFSYRTRSRELVMAEANAYAELVNGVDDAVAQHVS
jgi:hypothetical protein